MEALYVKMIRLVQLLLL